MAWFGSSGSCAGVDALTRALGSSGESDLPSCSAMQHSLEAMLACVGQMVMGRMRAKRRNGLMFVDAALSHVVRIPCVERTEAEEVQQQCGTKIRSNL